MAIFRTRSALAQGHVGLGPNGGTFIVEGAPLYHTPPTNGGQPKPKVTQRGQKNFENFQNFGPPKMAKIVTPISRPQVGPGAYKTGICKYRISYFFPGFIAPGIEQGLRYGGYNFLDPILALFEKNFFWH